VADDSMPANWDEPLFKLYRTVAGLCSRTVAGMCSDHGGGLVGDADVDALIAATLGVEPHPYTSDDAHAQTLLPDGWTWTSVNECVRGSDSRPKSFPIIRNVRGSDGTSLPDPLMRCLVAINACQVDHSRRTSPRRYLYHLLDFLSQRASMLVIHNVGSPKMDAYIAGILSVPSLPYTSNDAAARTLLPAGWSWDRDDQERIVAFRASDQIAFCHAPILCGVDGSRTPISVPDPIARCVIAINAHKADVRNKDGTLPRD
jgi:hypothetical protein